jgi:hypothetical protein
MEGDLKPGGGENDNPQPTHIKEWLTKRLPLQWKDITGEIVVPSKKELRGLLQLATDAETRNEDVYSGPDGGLAWLKGALSQFMRRKRGLAGLDRPISMFLRESPALMELALQEKRAEVAKEAAPSPPPPTPKPRCSSCGSESLRCSAFVKSAYDCEDCGTTGISGETLVVQ